MAIISNGLWRDRFGGSGTAIGKSIVLDGVETTVVGVLQPGFRFGTDYADVYIPIGQRKLVDANDRTVHDVVCVARLKPEVSLSQAETQMNAIQENIDRLNPETEQGLGAVLQIDSDTLVRKALEKLSPNFREVLILRELEGMSYREIADITGMPAGTVMSSLSRAQARFRQILTTLMKGTTAPSSLRIAAVNA